jgi:hypothetical protein
MYQCRQHSPAFRPLRGGVAAPMQFARASLTQSRNRIIGDIVPGVKHASANVAKLERLCLATIQKIVGYSRSFV